MKKSLLIGVSALTTLGMYAQVDGVTPIPNMFAKTISANGKYVGSQAGDVHIINVETGEATYYSDIFLGLGNAVADNGFAVGNGAGDIPTVLQNGQVIIPDNLKHLGFCDLNAVTPDFTRLVGIASSGRKGIMYVPFYCDINEDGVVGPPHVLPMPEKDFFGYVPQYATAVWISADGKTIAGQIVDNRGFLTSPIIFREDENGEWSYLLPTQDDFNPQNLPMPDDPYVNEPPYPEYVDFMDEDSRAIYEEEYEAWVMGAGSYPRPFDFMTVEQEQAYKDAVNKYDEWYESVEDEIENSLRQYFAIAATTVSTPLNELTLNAQGTSVGYMMGYEAFESPRNEIWIYDIENFDNFEVSKLNSRNMGAFPAQILPDGTVIAATPRDSGHNTFIKPAGQDNFMSFYSYLDQTNPSYAAWLNADVPNGAGLVSASDDLTVFAGGCQIYNLSNSLQSQWGSSNLMFYSYVMTDARTFAGVEENLVDADNGVYRVFNLQGVNVLTTENKADLNNLAKGIYIINGKKTIIR